MTRCTVGEGRINTDGWTGWVASLKVIYEGL